MSFVVEQTSLIQPFVVDFDLKEAILKNPKNHIVRRASDMRGYYKDEDALEAIIADGDPVHYEVFEVPVPLEYGHLMYGISTLQPGKVGHEYFFTKGHYHTVIQTGEIYMGLRGEGYMAMMTPDGEWNAQPVARDRMVYVPPYWAHRSVNTGDDALSTFFVYPADSGHNYGTIETEGFVKRIFDENGSVVMR